MPLRIGIISGEEAFARSLANVLTCDGHTILILPVGEVRKQTPLPELYIAVIAAEGGDIIETVIRLHKGRETRGVPVVVVSSSPELEDELPPVFDFMRKPVDMTRLREDIRIIERGTNGPVRASAERQLTEAEYRKFNDYLVSCCGLRFAPRNMTFLTRGIRSRMQVLQIHSYGEYYDFLTRYQESRQEMQKLLQLLTVGETYFFRYRPHFEVLSRLIRKEFGQEGKQSLRIWSAGCSTGEEPYSIAMSILDAVPDWRSRDVTVLATDINKRSLKMASEGVYRPWAMRAMDQRHIRRYFDRTGDSYRLKDEVRDAVTFFPLNLKSPFPLPARGLADLDVVFCRNVLIYFGIDDSRSIVEKLAATLKPGGYLFLGHSETLSFLSTQFERHSYAGGFYYRKRGDATPAAVIRERRGAREPKRTRPVPVKPIPPVVAAVVEPEPDPEALFALAVARFGNEEYQAAALALEKVVAMQPGHVGALVLRSFILANSGRLDAAFSLCERALSLDDLRPDAYLLKGLILELTGQDSLAVAEYRKAILLDMSFLMPHYYLGRLLLRLGRETEGRRELRTCLRTLERSAGDEAIPYGGGMTRSVLLQQLRREIPPLKETPSAEAGGSATRFNR